MYSIKENYIHEEIIKKSKFITYLYKISNTNEVKEKINNIKLKHKGANHICYAYKLNEIERCNDDGEPSGTAGMPILNVLQKENLNFILCIIVRYFGGIKLGAGGLIRAYSGCCKNAIKLNKIVKIEKGIKIQISFAYNNVKNIDSILEKVNITNKEYDVLISYVFEIKQSEFEKIKDKLNLLCIEIKIIDYLYL